MIKIQFKKFLGVQKTNSQYWGLAIAALILVLTIGGIRQLIVKDQNPIYIAMAAPLSGGLASPALRDRYLSGEEMVNFVW